MTRVTDLPILKDFDHIEIPEVIPTNILFDLFNFAPDHPARSTSDTYYVNPQNVLRTHDTVMWYYYFQLEEIKKKIAEKKELGVMCYGKVYRKDEIDRHHMNIFHQMGGLYLVPDSEKMLTIEDLKAVLSEVVQSVFGKDIKYRFNPDTFPYTDPSLEVEVEINGGLRSSVVVCHAKVSSKISAWKATTAGPLALVWSVSPSSVCNSPTSASSGQKTSE
jgi:phenylalanyl-tRNA synthetase alpha chain